MRLLLAVIAAILVSQTSFAEDLKVSEATATTTATTAAAPAPADPAKAEIHRNKARILIDQKNWEQALIEIRQATDLDPNSLDSWLVRGTVAMRQEQVQEAYDAFNKYLSLNPPADKATAVRQRIAELELRLEKFRADEAAKKAAEAEDHARRTGPQGVGFLFGFSSFKPALTQSDDLNSTMSSTFDLGFRFSFVDVGFQFGGGDVDQITVKRQTNNQVVGTFTKGKHTFMEFYTRSHIALKEPQGGVAGSAFYIPILLGGFMNNAKFDKLYGNIGFDLGTGVQYRFYTGSNFVFDLMGLYHLGLPFWKFQNSDAEILEVYNKNGNRVNGSISGLELRGGVTILF
jgi:tetratricopeptide (TPR) repeat protein